MKAKLIILVIVAAAMVSFTFANQSKKEQHKSASSVNGRQLDDRGQFN
jgi:hypothetical protein